MSKDNEAHVALQRVAKAVTLKIERVKCKETNTMGLQGHYDNVRIEALKEVENLLKDELYKLAIQTS